MMACVVEWCLKIPVHSMLETSESDKGCLFNVFQVRLVECLAGKVMLMTPYDKSISLIFIIPKYSYLDFFHIYLAKQKFKYLFSYYMRSSIAFSCMSLEEK